jgi:tetratricopeptide (TPR) repeat protein
MLDVPDPDAVIAERLSGQGPFVATDPFMAPEPFGDDQPAPILTRPEDRDALRQEFAEARDHDAAPAGGEEAPPHTPPAAGTGAREPEPDIPLRPRVPERKRPAGHDIDLNQVLEQLKGASARKDAAPAAPPPQQNLDEVFNDFRSEISKQTGAHEAGEQLALARTYIDMSMADEAIAALRAAARAPAHRFEASAMLGRLYLKKKELAHAIEWLERAAEAPAPSANDARELLYELGAILEATGETSRALAVFLELQADAGEYRDVAARVERLARVQAGG